MTTVNKVTVPIEVTDHGTTQKLTKDAKLLNNEYTKAQKNANLRPAGETAALGKAKVIASRSVGTTDTPGLERGATGVGGGSGAKDFSRQAQGLGGLVHVYATFAANIFAVSAAFTALKKAADYTNMVEGLNQLGAASGRNLGSMAKNMAKLSEGAISLKQAIEVTAQGSAAGMTSEQMDRMTVAAKRASQALGRDMGDSLSRLSRGIIKIEPELLDELGIMVRVDRAAQDYARTLGKTAASLSEFEKRQAFAIAVLDQSEKKFGNINIDANPFNKLEATFINLLYLGGELLNKVLGPIAKILGDSPVALAVGMAALAAMLLNKAIPALTNWREGLQKAAKESAALAKETAERALDFKAARVFEGAEKFQEESEARKKVYAEEARAAAHSAFSARSAIGKSISEGTFTPDNKLAQTTKAELAKTSEKIRKLENDSIDASAKELKNIKNLLLTQGAREAQLLKILTIMESITEENRKQNELLDQAEQTTSSKAKFLSADWRAEQVNKRAQINASKYEVLSSVAHNTQVMGMAGAWQQLGKDIEDTKKKSVGGLSGLSELTTKAKGGMMILSTTVTGVVSALSNLFMVVTVLTVAYQALNSWLTTNDREQKTFSESIDRTEESIEGALRTISLLESKSLFENLSYESLQAKANGINEISSSLNKLVKDFEKVEATQSIWSSGIDDVLSIFGSSNKQKVSANVAEAITTAMTLAPEGDARNNAAEKLSSITGLAFDQLTNLKLVNQEIKKLGAGSEKVIGKVLDQLTKDVNNPVSQLKAGLDSLTEATKQYDNLVNSLSSRDPFSQMAVNAVRGFQQLQSALTDTASGMSGLIEISQDFGKLKLFPEENARALLALGNSVKNYTTDLAALEKRLKLEKEHAEFLKNPRNHPGRPGAVVISNMQQASQGKAKATENEIAQLKTAQKDYVEAYGRALEAGTKHSIKLLTEGLEVAYEKAGLVIKRSIIAGIDSPLAAKLEGDYKNKEVDIGLRMLDSQTNLLISQERLRLAIEENSLIEKQKTATPEQKSQIEKALGQVQSAQEFLLNRDSKTLNQKDITGVMKLNPQMLTVIAGLMGRDAQRATGGAQKKANNLATNINVGAKEAAREAERVADQKKINDLKAQEIDFSIQLAGTYVESLATKRDELRTIKDSADLKLIDVKREQEREEYTKRITAAVAGNNKKEIDVVSDNFAWKMRGLQVDEQALKLQQKRNNLQIGIKDAQDKLLPQKEALEVQGALLAMEATALGYQRESGTHSELQSINERASVEIRALQLSQQKDLVDQVSKEAHLRSVGEITAADAVSSQIKHKETLNNLAVEALKIQRDYQAALVATEDTLRSIEKLGISGEGNVAKYFGALADDFNNKLGQMVKAAKSAGDTFNQGLISAVDTTIDKFFDAMQKSELNFKDMVKFARNALSDVFKDTASQLAKNAWKDTLKGIMGDSTIEAAAKATSNASAALQQSQTILMNQQVAEQKTSNTLLQQIVTNTSKTTPSDKPKGSGESFGSTDDAGEMFKYSNVEVPEDGVLREAGKKQESAAITQLTTAELAKKSLEGFMSDSAQVLSGQMTVVQLFKNTVSRLGPLFSTFISGLWGAIQGLGGGGGGSSKGSFLGTLFKTAASAVMNYFVPGAGSMLNVASSGVSPLNYIGEQAAHIDNAKGGIYSSPSLSAYSNSVVSSPTMFAFAQGGVPNRGLMGEAGPEAIMPLKRDSSGNLGIRGGGNVNNVTITINIEEGQAKDVKSTGSDQGNMASQLGNIIKATVTDELIKQSRPGGLLAR